MFQANQADCDDDLATVPGAPGAPSSLDPLILADAETRETRVVYERDSLSHAGRYLDFVAKTAAERAVTCETLTESRDDIYQAIIDIAQARACDLIVMASHGRRGIAGLLVGSQTQHVLTHSRIPVLVCR